MSIECDNAVSEFEWDIPDGYTLPGVIESHAAAFGERVAVRFRDDDGSITERTYSDLSADMNWFANALADHGIGKGDRVLHLFPRHSDGFAL